MKLLNVYKTDDDLIIDTSEGLRVCKLRHNNFVDIEIIVILVTTQRKPVIVGFDTILNQDLHDILVLVRI